MLISTDRTLPGLNSKLRERHHNNLNSIDIFFLSNVPWALLSPKSVGWWLSLLCSSPRARTWLIGLDCADDHVQALLITLFATSDSNKSLLLPIQLTTELRDPAGSSQASLAHCSLRTSAGLITSHRRSSHAPIAATCRAPQATAVSATPGVVQAKQGAAR